MSSTPRLNQALLASIEHIDVQDPLADRLKKLYQLNNNHLSQWVQTVFAINEIFPMPLQNDKVVINAVCKWLTLIRKKSVDVALVSCLEKSV